MGLFCHHKLTVVDTGSRYLFGLPGALLTSYALYRHLEPLKQTGLTVVIRHLKCMIPVFALYGILSGAIVPTAGFFPASVLNYDWMIATFGTPIQIFRAICAALLAYCTLRVLSVFHWETQQQFRENESRLRTIASASPAILFKSTISGQLTSIEGQGIEALSAPAHSLIGQPISALFPDFDFKNINAQSWKKGSVYSGNVTAHDKTYDIGYCPVQDETGEISGYVGAAMDISRRLKAQAEINAYRRELTQTRRLTELGMMSKVLATKLRKPLNVTQVLLQRLAVDLEKSNPDAGISKIIEQSLTEVHEAFSTVKRFCDHVDIPALPKTTVLDPEDFFNRIIAVFSDRAQRANLDIILDSDPSDLCLMIAAKELQYIVSTLIEHILDRANPDTTQTLTIQCQHKPEHILILFSDTCRRLSREEVKNAFVPFALKTADSGQNELGLAVVQKIAEENQGSITIHSQEGKGTLFALSLPTCQTHEVQT
ncbi:MAG: HAMP domain-containing histidine kinase [Planctomycetes bacterium]|nr:HAMP domain-containing histidine kinase [Planctomycetota bacterium]